MSSSSLSRTYLATHTEKSQHHLNKKKFLLRVLLFCPPSLLFPSFATPPLFLKKRPSLWPWLLSSRFCCDFTVRSEGPDDQSMIECTYFVPSFRVVNRTHNNLVGCNDFPMCAHVMSHRAREGENWLRIQSSCSNIEFFCA
jgi:hypothetical protein